MASEEAEQQIRALNQQVSELYEQAKHVEALEPARRACELSRRALGDNHPDTVTSLNHLGDVMQALEDLAGARLCFEQALDIRRRVLGDDHRSTAISFKNLGEVLRELGDLEAAKPCYEKALAICRRVLGDDHPNTGACFTNLGILLHKMGDLTGARPHYEQALEIGRRVRGDDHPDTATDLENLGYLLKAMGDLAGARRYYEQALEINRRALGDDHRDTASNLNDLGYLSLKLGELDEARRYLEQALAIRRRVLGDNHPETASTLNNLGLLIEAMGNLPVALSYYEKALESFRRALGEEHRETATCLGNLGVLLQALGELDAARRCLEQALAIRRRVLGNDHRDTATSLGNLGVLLRDMGDLAGARSCLEQTLGTFRRLLGDDHLEIATALDVLGLVFSDLGDLTAARPCLEEALRIRRRALGENHPSTAISLNNLGCLLQEMGDRAAARPYYEQALEIHRRTLGENHPDTAINFNNMGYVLQAMGDLVAARPYLEKALEISRRALGEAHFETATSLNNLGLLLLNLGDLTEARPCLVQTLGILRRALGDNHPKTAISFHNLGTLEAASGRIEEALALMRQSTDIEDRMIGQVFSIASDRQRMLFLETLQGFQDCFLSLIYRHLPGSPEAVRIAFDLVLRRKALGAEALGAQRDAVLGGRYPHLHQSFEQLTQLRRRIAQNTLSGPASGETLADHEQTLQQWQQEQQQRETELARQIPEMKLEQRLHMADRRAVALGLDEGVALVEFVRFDVFDFHAVPVRGERRWQPARYVAFVLPGGQPDQVQMIDLGEARSIDLMIADFRASVAVDPRDPNRDIRRQSPESPLAPRGQIGPALRAAVFDKLVPTLAGCKRLLLAPDGDLTRLPFEVLPDTEGHFLLEQYAISYLSCGRDVLRFGAVPSRQPAEPLVVADPLFDLAMEADTSAPTVPTQSSCSRDFKRTDYHFPRLPGTREEGERVAELLGVQPWLASDALEARLKERRSPRLLHLATHGFFLTDQERDPNKESRALEMIGAEAGSAGRLSGPLPENPLLRSGLALAGAQTWLDGKALPPEAEDGLLTAEDVTGLDLLDTELVVLSACETGLGEVRTGEGVFGLRRAFIVAGARTLVMSLWKVPDEQTRELMIDFYRRVLHGQGVADALRDAQLAMKGKYPDPYFWGAFICQGDPGPLASFQPQMIAADTAGSVPAMEAKEKLASL
ncbi:MAG TPA: tetratricopeptide repeat protein [Gemmataceae bacterium]|jgi:tetratricopeptide (TPR) repeat protein/CHAT domain-containing protein